MKFIKYTLLVALYVISAFCANAKNKQTTLYMYGVAASFNDSTIYFTDVQQVDSAWIETSNNFLISRDNYSYQLRDFLANHGEPNRTCIVSFATTAKKAQKKYQKTLNKYLNAKKENFDVRYLKREDFAFKSIVPYEAEEQNAETKKEKKIKKKKENTRKRPTLGAKPQEGMPNQPPMGGDMM